MTEALNAIHGTIESWIVANEWALSQLWQGLTWSVKQTGNLIGATPGAVYGALHFLWTSQIPYAIGAALDPVTVIAHDAKTLAQATYDVVGEKGAGIDSRVADGVTTAETYTDKVAKSIEGDIATAKTAAIASAGTTAGQLVAQTVTYIDNQVRALQGEVDAVPGEIRQAVAGLAGGVTLDDVNGAINDALAASGSIGRAIHQAVAGLAGGLTVVDVDRAIAAALAGGGSIDAAIHQAVAEVNPGVTLVEVQAAIGDALGSSGSIAAAITAAVATIPHGLTADQVDQAVNSAIAGAIAGGGAIDQVIAGVTSRIEQEIAAIPVPDVATLTTAVAAVGATVAVLEAEAGLGNPECRAKVKGICSTDPAAWAQLLGGLVAIGLATDFAELVKLAQDGMSDSYSAVESLVG